MNSIYRPLLAPDRPPVFPCRTDKGIIDIHPDDTFRTEILCFSQKSASNIVESPGEEVPTYLASYLTFVASNVKDACPVEEDSRQ